MTPPPSLRPPPQSLRPELTDSEDQEEQTGLDILMEGDKHTPSPTDRGEGRGLEYSLYMRFCPIPMCHMYYCMWIQATVSVTTTISLDSFQHSVYSTRLTLSWVYRHSACTVYVQVSNCVDVQFVLGLIRRCVIDK